MDIPFFFVYLLSNICGQKFEATYNGFGIGCHFLKKYIYIYNVYFKFLFSFFLEIKHA